ncbi:hypothetical protein OVA11_19215 [Caulobacter sp. SL161]|uniref:hypothetical protein n=1 Tax=Caulobacter sp. SL161 TaxID=2995156 RepID=UPI002274987B|nr:hypothetical protein [Caulobacter sp. SL161]MCY1649109.1 hypothetical protein [Caulobacter sp. SL161]
MTQPAPTLADIVAYHATEAENYTAKATGWARSAELLKTGDSVANAVRISRFSDAAQLASDIGARHAEMAAVLKALSARP